MQTRSNTALEAFDRWSNYLLVTTVAAVGWISSDNVRFHSDTLRDLSLWSLGVSVVFGILALALVPLVAEQAESERSIFRVKARFSFAGIALHGYLTQACRPQHAFFILGIVFYCAGTTADLWLALAIGAAAL
jgi:hypothetical protein